MTFRTKAIRRTRGLLLLLIAVAAAESRSEALPDIVERVTPSVVGVGAAYPPRAPTGGRPPLRLLGTGFALTAGDRSMIVTNAHVIARDLDVDGREQLAVFAGRGTQVRPRAARLLASDEQHDLALLAYDGTPLPGLQLAAAQRTRPGERVAFTGFPIGAVLGLFPATHEGIVAAITPVARPANAGRDLDAVQMRRLREPFDVYQLDAIAYPGNSGSPVYRQGTGEVIGVMNSVFVKESRESLLSAPSGIAYAIPADHVRALLERLP